MINILLCSLLFNNKYPSFPWSCRDEALQSEFKQRKSSVHSYRATCPKSNVWQSHVSFLTTWGAFFCPRTRSPIILACKSGLSPVSFSIFRRLFFSSVFLYFNTVFFSLCSLHLIIRTILTRLEKPISLSLTLFFNPVLFLFLFFFCYFIYSFACLLILKLF